ncbi:MAG: hypothetical protein KF812_00370 [Fimbriimonadaceae bacterium]|nr:hypothetical protein [Fimbriimonadaceae bacterium]
MKGFGLVFGALTLVSAVAGAQDPPAFVRLLEQPIIVQPSPNANWGEPYSAYEWQGWKLEFDAQGNLSGRRITDGGWADAKQLIPAGVAGQPPVRVPIKVVLNTRTSSVSAIPDGRVTVKRGTIERRQLQAILASLARFKTLAEGQALGRIVIDFEVTEDETWLDLPDGNRAIDLLSGSDSLNLQIDSFREEFVRTRVLPAANRAYFASDGAPVPGPYGAIFVIHGALNDHTYHANIDGMPVSVLAYNTFTNADPAMWLDQFLVQGMYAQAAMRLGERGSQTAPDYRQRTRLSNVTLGDLLLNADASLPTFTADAATEVKPTRLTRSEAWSSVFARIPHVDPISLAVWSGSSYDREIHNVHLNRRTAIWTMGNKQVLLSDPGYLDAVLDLVGGQQGLEALGWIDLENGRLPWIALDVTGRNLDGSTDKSVLGITPQPTNQPDQVSLPEAHGMTATPAPNQNGVFQIQRQETIARGYVVIDRPGTLGTRYGFRIRTESREPLALQFVDADGNYLYEYRFFNRTLSAPSVSGLQVPTMNLVVPMNNEWQNVVVDTGPIQSRGEVAEIRLAPPIGSEFFDRQEFGTSTVLYARLETDVSGMDVTAVDLPYVVMGPVSLLRDEPHELSAEEWQSVQTAFASPLEPDRITALAVLARHRHPEAMTIIAPALKMPVPAILNLALDAFQNQATDSAAIIDIAKSAPLSYMRALAFGRLDDAARAEMFDVMNRLASSSVWSERSVGLLAMNGRPEPLIPPTMTLALQDPDAGVRYIVTNHWFTRDELSGRRLMFTALNDPSEAIRAAANDQLSQFEQPAVQAEARRGLRDDSPFVRADLIRRWGARNVEAEAMKGALADEHAIVRVAVLEVDEANRFLTVDEVVALTGDKDRRVIKAAVQNLVARGDEVSDEVWSQLQQSPRAWLAAYVRSLRGTSSR